MKNKELKKLILAALFLALGLLLPFLTGQIKQFGNMMQPMHLPVMLCGLVCGWQYGLAVGFITPLLRSALFGMPVLYPNAIGMAFELAAYGLLIALVYRLFRKQNILAIYTSLLAAMVGGRIVWGIVRTLLYGLDGNSFTFSYFIAAGVMNAVPGIILQLVLIPAAMLILEKAKVLEKIK